MQGIKIGPYFSGETFDGRKVLVQSRLLDLQISKPSWELGLFVIFALWLDLVRRSFCCLLPHGGRAVARGLGGGIGGVKVEFQIINVARRITEVGVRLGFDRRQVGILRWRERKIGAKTGHIVI